MENSIDKHIKNPYKVDSIEGLLYLKNWIDHVQWQLEDIIRDPAIDPVVALEIKRRIDKSNQHRTDVVEQIDDYFLAKYANVNPKKEISLNTESPAWALDRLSILLLKIHYMQLQTVRKDVDKKHLEQCQNKLAILLEQKKDLSLAIDTLLDDFSTGKKQIKVYRQMKMYNDPNLNPVLYKSEKLNATTTKNYSSIFSIY